MLQVTHFKKSLAVERSKPFGTIRIFFGAPDRYYDFPPLSLTRFMALSHILENNPVLYDPTEKVLHTPTEISDEIDPMA